MTEDTVRELIRTFVGEADASKSQELWLRIEREIFRVEFVTRRRSTI